MAHKVSITLPERELGNADLILDVSTNATKIGKLRVSKASISWVPANCSIRHKMSWKQFARLMEDNVPRES
jgi:hypothetical protein